MTLPALKAATVSTCAGISSPTPSKPTDREPFPRPAHNQTKSGLLQTEPQYRQSGRIPDYTAMCSGSTQRNLSTLPGVTMPSHFQ